MIRKNLLNSRNVFDEDNEERADWVEDMDEPPDHGYIKETAEVVYFTGCVASYFPLAQNIPIALAEVLEAGGIDFTLLGEEEWCCGFPLLGAGLKELFHEFMEHNLQAIRDKGAKEVIFACPSCFQMWREFYPQEFKISHATQYFLRLVKENRIPLKELKMKVTYHDPCDLGRKSGVYDAPREVMARIPGLELREMAASRENALCCGGGGDVEISDPTVSTSVAGRRLRQVQATGARYVASACQQCKRTLQEGARRNKIRVRAIDVAELVWKSIEAAES